MPSASYERFLPLEILMNPILYNDLMVTFLDFGHVSHDKNWTVLSHKDPWYEFNYIATGSMYTTIAGEEFLAPGGSFFLIPPGTAHSHRHHAHEGDEGLCLRFLLEKSPYFDGSTVRKTADDVIQTLGTVSARPFFYPADRLLTGIQNASPEQMETALMHWLMEIKNVIAPARRANTENWREGQRTNLAKRVMMYLEDRYPEELDVNVLAHSMGYSYRHLSRLFREETGATITDKLNGIRIARAMELLEQPELSIQRIGEMVGFHSAAYFSTMFSQHAGCSPAAYRKKMQQDYR